MPTHQITITAPDGELSFPCDGDTPILEAAEEAGFEDLPYGCRNGVCGACVHVITEGQVDLIPSRFAQIPELIGEPPPVRFHVVAYDFGMKRNILRRFRQVGCRATVVPAGTSAEDVLARLVPVDLRAGVFKKNHVAKTMLGHMAVTITRTDTATFEIMVMRAMARTLVHDLDIAMRGVAAR